MPILHLSDVPIDVLDSLHQLAVSHHRTLEAEALELLQRGVSAARVDLSQDALLTEMRRRSFTPPPGTPDCVELLREDRGR